MRPLNEYEPWPNEYQFKKRRDMKPLVKCAILIRWWLVKWLVPKKNRLSTRYPTGMLPPREYR